LHRLAPHFPGPELCICAASVPSEIWCLIRFFPPRLAICNAFCCCFHVVERGVTRGGGFPSWMGNFRRQACRPQNRVICCMCGCCNYGLGALCKFWKQISKFAGKSLSFDAE
jgi:hypothetical protein